MFQTLRKMFTRAPAPPAVIDNAAHIPAGAPGDEWRDRAHSMLGQRLAKIRCDGGMGERETLLFDGICTSITREPDGSSPKGRVIWCALGNQNRDGAPFSVIVARCWFNEPIRRGRWEERY